MLKRFARTLAVSGMLAGLGLTVPSAAPAQAKFELTPFAGSFYPLMKMCTDCNNDGSDVRGRLLNAAAVGGRLTYWFTGSLGFEGAVGYTWSRVEISVDASGFATALSGKGTVLLASGRLLYRPSRTNLHFIIGGGMVKRGGDLWKSAKDIAGTKLTSPAGILGLGVRASVTPKFALNVTAEGHFYSYDPRFGPTGDESNGSKLQTDLLLSIGVPITLMH
jgi:hypothetical protein